MSKLTIFMFKVSTFNYRAIKIVLEGIFHCNIFFESAFYANCSSLVDFSLSSHQNKWDNISELMLYIVFILFYSFDTIGIKLYNQIPRMTKITCISHISSLKWLFVSLPNYSLWKRQQWSSCWRCRKLLQQLISPMLHSKLNPENLDVCSTSFQHYL